jgi:hypothetical protein
MSKDHAELQVAEISATIHNRASTLEGLASSLAHTGNNVLAKTLYQEADALRDCAIALNNLSFRLVDEKVKSAHDSTDAMFKALFTAVGIDIKAKV